MKHENTHFPVSSLFSKQLNLSDFSFGKTRAKTGHYRLKSRK